MSRSPLSEALIESAQGLLSIAQFWRTRAAVRKGLPLHEFDDEARDRGGFASPWQFSVQEVVLATVPSFLLVGMLDLLFGQLSTSAEQIAGQEAQRLFEKIYGWLDNFTVPALMTLAVYLVSWGALKAKDANPQSRLTCREAYLYLNGAYGLVPQAGLTTGIAYLAWQQGRGENWITSPTGAWLGQIALAVILISSVWILWRLAKVIPRKLFAVFGYTDRAAHFWQKRRDDDPPWSKYATAVFLGGWPLAWLWNVIIISLSSVLTSGLGAIRAGLVDP